MTITHVYQLCAKENSLYRNAHFSERPHIKPLNEPPPSYVQDHSFLLKAVLLDRQLSDPRGTAHGLKTLCATCHTQERPPAFRGQVMPETNSKQANVIFCLEGKKQPSNVPNFSVPLCNT